MDSHNVMFSPYAKYFHLYQHTPNHSSHPPGVLQYTIKAILYTIGLCCTHKSTYHERIQFLCNKLLEYNHKTEILQEIFREVAGSTQLNLNSPRQLSESLTRNNKYSLYLM